MGGYSKLFSSIVTSSVWCEDHATLRVWIAMLATCDAQGTVDGSIPGFANLARVTLPEMRLAVDRLSSPDPDSRTPDNEGRRIEAIPGGWRILNYESYRNRLQEKQGSKARAMRESRERKGNALPDGVTRYPDEQHVTLPASAIGADASAYQGESTTGTRMKDWAGPVPEDDL